MSDTSKPSVAYYCEGCERLMDLEQHPPKRLRVQLARANRREEQIVDVFLCPVCSGMFVDDGAIASARERSLA